MANDITKNLRSHEAIQRLREANHLSETELFQITIDYLNKISGSKATNDYYSLRDSISQRSQSILFHHEIFESINNSSAKKIIEGDDPIPLIGSQIALNQDFLFDSIIFNLVSLFDYASCLVRFIMEKNKEKRRERWPKLVRKARNNPKFKETPLAKKIIQIDTEWAKHLIEYRAELIHYKDDFVYDSSTFNVVAGEAIFTISAPQNIYRFFKNLKPQRKELNINDVTFWLIENSFLEVKELFVYIRGYIEENRLRPPGSEVIRTSNPKAM